MLARLQQRREIGEPVAIVVAHPDDETIAAGGSMHLFRDLLLIHVTDGAPRNLPDAAREGFATPEAYAAARSAELDSALALSGARPRRVTLGVPDQGATDAVTDIATRLRALLREHRIAAILTHAYEGGHPDHDATALAVRLAGAHSVHEFAGYYAGPDGSLATGQFLPGPDAVSIRLPPEDAARKAAMLACFRTQAEILACFDPAVERFRIAPAYDFTAPPHAGRLNYENWGWSMTGAHWRRHAAAALEGQCAA